MIPYGRQDISQQDIDEVIDVLTSDFLTQGPKVPEFEDALTQFTGAKYASAANSATSALHIACLALGAGPGTQVWTSPITFVASSNAALYCGADVDFVDVDPVTYNMCPKALETKLKAAKETGTLPKIVIPVHLCGQSCDMETIHDLSKEYGFAIIEDASHAVGGYYQDKPVGACQYSDICIFSFHPVKIITTAEGGAALTNDEKLDQKIKLLRSHGITRDDHLMRHESHGPWYYEQIDLGFNYRMTELQAALGCSQITRLSQYVEKRNAIAEIYDDKLSSLPLILPKQSEKAVSSRHLYVIKIDQTKTSVNRKDAFEKMRSLGLGVNVHYIPVVMQPYYQDLGFNASDYPCAVDYYENAISIPLYPTMSDDDIHEVIAVITKVFEA